MTLPGTPTLDDACKDLVRLAQRGDSGAFDRLIRVWYQQIYRWALSQTEDRDDADDVTQEVLVRLHTKLSSYRGRSRFSTWLYQVTRNASLELHRGRERRRRGRDRLGREAAGSFVEGVEVRRLDASTAVDAVRRVVGSLPAGQRRVFELADFQGFTPKEIGEMLGMPAVTVRAHLCKARRAVRRKILEQHPQLTEGLG